MKMILNILFITLISVVPKRDFNSIGMKNRYGLENSNNENEEEPGPYPSHYLTRNERIIVKHGLNLYTSFNK